MCYCPSLLAVFQLSDVMYICLALFFPRLTLPWRLGRVSLYSPGALFCRVCRSLFISLPSSIPSFLLLAFSLIHLRLEDVKVARPEITPKSLHSSTSPYLVTHCTPPPPPPPFLFFFRFPSLSRFPPTVARILDICGISCGRSPSLKPIPLFSRICHLLASHPYCYLPRPARRSRISTAGPILGILELVEPCIDLWRQVLCTCQQVPTLREHAS